MPAGRGLDLILAREGGGGYRLFRSTTGSTVARFGLGRSSHAALPSCRASQPLPLLVGTARSQVTGELVAVPGLGGCSSCCCMLCSLVRACLVGVALHALQPVELEREYRWMGKHGG